MTPTGVEDTYPQQASDLVDRLPDDDIPTIVAGDFNASWRNDHHLRNVEVLAGRGLVNAYDALHGIPPGGKPEDATSFFRRSELVPHHMDFVFVPMEWWIAAVEIGAFKDYVATGVSDHVPVVVAVSLDPAGSSI
jgi:endonuclease/exonuclease/phosphatase family metal-dependent hydrolase